jgi:hypothetical protein
MHGRKGVATRGALPRLRGRGEQGDNVRQDLRLPVLYVEPVQNRDRYQISPKARPRVDLT